ncbi:hypothetical protein AVEN_69738-1 [Araneus ventricosus]|uniref:Uncharacterized protein n=1 Tax=Araneus ventricosus TaxID=182803 RepID=A0A4Y2CXD7_ARAVE|nr:hypothetical protein AVEN_69738-1 [Araneus ventricosus]
MSGRRGLPLLVLLCDSGDISDGVSSVILEECFCSRVSVAVPNIDGSEERVKGNGVDIRYRSRLWLYYSSVFKMSKKLSFEAVWKCSLNSETSIKIRLKTPFRSEIK